MRKRNFLIFLLLGGLWPVNAKDFAMAVCGAVLPCDSLFGKPAPESVLRPLSQFSSKKLINTPAVNNGTRIRIR